MQFDIKELLSGSKRELSVNFVFSAQDMNLGGEITYLSDCTISGHVRIVNSIPVLYAEIKTEVSVPCDRCLEPVHFDIDIKAETDLLSDELDCSADRDSCVLENGAVDLVYLCRTAVHENIPIKVLCRDDCKGFEEDL